MADSVFSVAANTFADTPNVLGFESQVNTVFAGLLNHGFTGLSFVADDQARLLGNELDLTVNYDDAGTVITNPYQVKGFAGKSLAELNTLLQAFIDANPTYFRSAVYTQVLHAQERLATYIAIMFFNVDFADGTANWHVGGGISLPIPAADVSYFNTGYPDLTNVQEALDQILHVTFSASMSGGGVAEHGQSFATRALTWSYNKAISAQSLSGSGTVPPLLAARSQTATGPFTANTTWGVNATSTGAESASASTTLTFLDKNYWGTSSNAGPLNSAQVLALANSLLTTTYVGLYSFTPSNEYLWMCFPTTYGTPVFRVNGLITTFQATVITFTNSFGYATSYTLYRSQFLQNGNVTVAASAT